MNTFRLHDFTITDEFLKEWNKRKLIYRSLQSVYILENDKGNIRFGISNKAKDRMNDISYNGLFEIINSYQSIGYSNAREILRKILKHFDAYKIKGQWFNIKYKDGLDYLIKTCNKIGNTTKILINDKPDDLEIATFNLFHNLEI